MKKTMENERSNYEIEHEYLLRQLQKVHKAMSNDESEAAGDRDRKLFDDWNDGKMTDKRVYLRLDFASTMILMKDCLVLSHSFSGFTNWVTTIVKKTSLGKHSL